MTGRTSAASSRSTEHRLDRNARRLSAGQLVLGGEPPRLVRLSAAGASALDGLIDGLIDGRAARAGHAGLGARLVTAGILHPRFRDPGGVAPGDVTVVVPSRQPPRSLGDQLAGLVDQGIACTVVDDASPDFAAASADAAHRSGATLVQRTTQGGPGAARNSASPGTRLVAFLDADIEVDPIDPTRWLAICARHFEDPRIALVAPRVRAAPAGGTTHRILAYEELESPLDLGEHPGLVGRGRRLSYVPAAAMIVRAAALSGVRGFDEDLAYGEDVDLVRRLEASGWLVRYDPDAVVGHQVRGTFRALARQRYRYGTAAAQLDRLHPGTVAPFASNASAAAAAAIAGLALATRSRLLACAPPAIALASALRLASRLRGRGVEQPGRLAASLVGRGMVRSAGGVLVATRRVWWPPLVVAGLAMPRSRRSVAALVVGAHLAGHGPNAWRRARQAPDLARALADGGSHLVLGVVDDVAYGAGVLAGCVGERSLGALRPRLRSTSTDRRGT